MNLSHFRDRQFFAAGEVIFAEGEPGDRMYVLLEGEIAVTVEGRRLNVLRPGSIVGEMALIDDGPRSATAAAETDCRVAPIDRDRFLSLVQHTPEFALQIMGVMTRRLRRLIEEGAQRLRLEEEMAVGRRIQLSLLPEAMPQFPGWQFAAAYQSARQVGGDLFDFIGVAAAPHLLDLAVADVSGKGVPAALLMGVCRTMIRATAHRERRPAEVLRQVNRLMVEDSRTRLFLSAFLATLDTSSGRLLYASAGHEPPQWYRAGPGAVAPLPGRGAVLGAFKEAVVEEREVQLGEGDAVVLYTDGVTEAHDPDGRLFGEERLQEAIVAAGGESAEALLAGILAVVRAFTGDTPQSDDLTLVVVRREGAAGAS